MSLIFRYDTAVTDTKQLPSYSSQWQHRLWTSSWPLQDVSWTITRFLAAAQVIDINTVSGGIKYHRSLSKRFNPENKPFFTSDTLLLLRVKLLDRTCPTSMPAMAIIFQSVDSITSLYSPPPQRATSARSSSSMPQASPAGQASTLA